MKNLNKFLIIALSFFVLGSCSLDLRPDGALVSTEVVKDYSSIVRVTNGLADLYRSCNYGVFNKFTEVQTDIFNASSTYQGTLAAAQIMGNNFTSGDQDTYGVWRTSFILMANINNFLDQIGNVSKDNMTLAEQKDVDRMTGEVYYYRAAIYHILVRKFAVDYEPSTASSDAGLPLVIKYDVNSKLPRSSVAEVYALINSDISKARELLANTPGTVRAVKPTIDVVKALDARVQLFMHNYEQAAIIAQELISSNKYTLASTAAAMTAEWLNDSGTEDIMQMDATKTEKGRVAGDIYLNWMQGVKKYDPQYIPTQKALDMYDSSTDLRYAEWFKSLPVRQGTQNYTLTLFTKFFGNPLLETAPTREYMHKEKIFRIAEMHLIRAEALLMQAAPDAAGALVALNTLQTARAATLTPATIQNVKIEWAKEMIGEGYRLDCLRRWKEGFSLRPPQDILTVMTGQSYDQIQVSPTTYFYTWPIPARETKLNPLLLPNNPGWGL